ncbi:hypothetical protein PYW07_000735 [Mythimna separata]|uniref:Enhancer of mRNA-decapping protein 4 C-terminal domain-containing protein n=1 Tax=Mythimna separata TaxID=271217 RepID=A0AAD7YRR0_MYTSE|nr:hypothetical protein PYW07_000735 [Mythimna separata]
MAQNSEGAVTPPVSPVITTNTSPSSQEQVDNEELVKTFCISLRSCNILEDRSFLECIKNNSLPSKEEFTEELLPEVYNRARLELMETLKAVQHVAISIEMWEWGTGYSVNGMLTATAHFVHQSKFISRTLFTTKMPQSFTTEIIHREIMDGLIKWQVLHKVTSLAASRTNISILEKELGWWREQARTAALTSRAHSPSTPHSHHAQDRQMQFAQIQSLIAHGDVNGAFQQALSASDLALVMCACRAADPAMVFGPPCKLKQHVLLSLVQQLAADMQRDTPLKHRYVCRPPRAAAPPPCKLKQHVLLSLVQQLAADMQRDTPLKHRYVCRPPRAAAPPPCKLKQHVLLSLVQQLAADMQRDTPLKHRYVCRPPRAAAPPPCKLKQHVLLSLVQQLAADMQRDTPLKHRYVCRPPRAAAPPPCKLKQHVLLSLVQQLAADMQRDTPLKHRYVCRPPRAAAPPPCKLKQHVLLSLVQQLAADCKYLEEAVMNLDTSNPVTREHLPGVVRELQKQLLGFLQATPNHALARQLRMLLMATEALVKAAA